MHQKELLKKGIAHFFSRFFQYRPDSAAIAQPYADLDESLASIPREEERLDECMDHADRDEDAKFSDVTDETLLHMKQQNAHSLDRDKNDFFFWNEARPDAVAGMAAVYLKARCPTPYWRSLVSSSSYGLWGAVAQAREEAQIAGSICGPENLRAACFKPLSEQASQLAARAKPRAQDESDFFRADGLPMSGEFFGEINKQAALRALFAAVLLGRSIAWPDLPPRLGASVDVPDKLPGLYIDLETLRATPAEVSRDDAEAFWDAQPTSNSHEILMIPDWASWMLASTHQRSFNKWPKFHCS